MACSRLLMSGATGSYFARRSISTASGGASAASSLRLGNIRLVRVGSSLQDIRDLRFKPLSTNANKATPLCTLSKDSCNKNHGKRRNHTTLFTARRLYSQSSGEEEYNSNNAISKESSPGPKINISSMPQKSVLPLSSKVEEVKFSSSNILNHSNFLMLLYNEIWCNDSIY